jgi:hypothetical protein
MLMEWLTSVCMNFGHMNCIATWLQGIASLDPTMGSKPGILERSTRRIIRIDMSFHTR